MSVALSVQAPQLPRWEAMRTAIAACIEVDDAKDIRDKSLALEAYYKQARDWDSERQAANVRLRAERRIGELLREFPRSATRGGGDRRSEAARNQTSDTRTNDPSPYAAELEKQGMSRQSAARFQALADVPEETFEAALAAPEKPSTAGLLKQAEARKQCAAAGEQSFVVSDRALNLWGRLRDLERTGLLDADCNTCAAMLAEMTDAMRADVVRLVPRLHSLATNLEEPDGRV